MSGLQQKLAERAAMIQGSRSSQGSHHLSRSQGSRVVGLRDNTHAVARLVIFLSDYMVMEEQNVFVTAVWAVAAWLSDVWDRFPHLAITSPVARCGKTRLLQLLEHVVPQPYFTPSATSAATYRLIESAHPRPTFLLDEQQSLNRRASEQSEVFRELLNSSIERKSKALRCGGKQMDEVHEFSLYCPKALSLIGQLEGVLADRCLPIRMERRTKDQSIRRDRARVIEQRGKPIAEEVAQWAEENRDRVAEAYDNLELFDIENDRMAELLLPLQAVLTMMDADLLPVLLEYARAVDAEDQDRRSLAVELLAALREIFTEPEGEPHAFLGTNEILIRLRNREDEPWERCNAGKPLTAERMAWMLKSFGIKPSRQQRKQFRKVITTRGYEARSFQDAWSRYLPCASRESGYLATPTTDEGEEVWTFLQFVCDKVLGPAKRCGVEGESFYECPFCGGKFHTLPHKPPHRDYWKCFGCSSWGDEAHLLFRLGYGAARFDLISDWREEWRPLANSTTTPTAGRRAGGSQKSA